MVEMCIIKDFYFENKQLADRISIPQSLSRPFQKWKSKWNQPTGSQYINNKQSLNYY